MSDDLKSELWKLTVEVRNLRAENERLRAELNEWYSAWGSPLREKQEGER